MKPLIQASTLNALMLGNFDQTISVKNFCTMPTPVSVLIPVWMAKLSLKTALLIVLLPKALFPQMKPEDGVAFGTVVAFDSNVPSHTLFGVNSLDELRHQLEPYVQENKNIFYMIKGQAEFNTMHVRSCFACQKPYPTLSEAASKQREFHYDHVSGSLIAVYCPAYVEGINLPGWHFHFLSGDKSKGGHVLGLSADHFTFQINPISEFSLLLPSIQNSPN